MKVKEDEITMSTAEFGSLVARAMIAGQYLAIGWRPDRAAEQASLSAVPKVWVDRAMIFVTVFARHCT